ncbi:SDR family oxidoreductase [Candidatus Njordibacter sp. Uisw_039]|uniref:SDR family oxidoreductase n=1 Tax=Candidatus Njordibacter sp. Uisw_039 TaxID=3230972 RepID=UPI003D520E53
MVSMADRFSLKGKIAIITGGAGLLGFQHAKAVAEQGGTPLLWDVNIVLAEKRAREINQLRSCKCRAFNVDITKVEDVKNAFMLILDNYKTVDILINNAANDPKPSTDEPLSWARIENFTTEMWQKDIDVGVLGAFNCSKIIGVHMASVGGGVILNIASDLGVIAPDQRIYQVDGLSDDQQPVKPVTYSVVKHALIGLTKYLATYWVGKNVRVNSLSPGGIHTNQPEEFVNKLTSLIPMGRMAKADEYQAAVIFLVSDASSYMTGSNMVVDGGRTCW